MIGAVVALLVLLAAGCRAESGSLIPPGRYSGSTADDRAVTIDFGSDDVRVNRKRADLVKPDRNNVFVARREPGRPRWECEVAAEGDELRCDVAFPDRSETIELMRE